MTKYLVTEIQTWESGAVQNPTWAYDENAAPGPEPETE